MTTKQEQLRAKADRLAAARVRQADPASSTRAAPPAASAPLAKDVRQTVDLSPARFRELQAWLGSAAVDLGRSRVTKQEALAGLVDLLITDQDIADRLLNHLRSQ